jgi:hypothetical protein
VQLIATTGIIAIGPYAVDEDASYSEKLLMAHKININIIPDRIVEPATSGIDLA